MRLTRKQRSPALHLALTALLLAAAAGVFCYTQWPLRSPEPAPLPAVAVEKKEALAGSLYEQVDGVLAELGVGSELIRKAHGASLAPAGGMGDRIAVRVPADLPLMELNLCLSRLVERCGGRVLSAAEHQHGQQVEIYCEAGQPTLFVLARATDLHRRTGLIALLLEDTGEGPGGGWRLLERFCALHPPLGLALQPEREHLAEVLALAKERGHQVLVNLPVDSEDPPDAEGLRQQLRLALKRVPEAVGVDVPVANAGLAAGVLREVKKQDLFFVDRATALDFDAGELAKTAKARAVRRDLFIDEENSRPAVEKKLWELAELAAQRGQALGVGQNREATLLALEAVLPRLESRGFRLISLSQMAR